MTDTIDLARPADSEDGTSNRALGKYRLAPAKAVAVRTAPPLVMDLKEASDYLVCSPRKLRDLVAARRVRHARVGAKIVIRLEWLDAFLER
jgi:excisionase family DNA binding protein